MFVHGNMEKAVDLDDRVVLAKESEAETENLILEYKPFLHSRVAKYSGRLADHAREDLFSVSMLAFHEAIQSYDKEKAIFFPWQNVSFAHG